jgi:hypothetical protein
MRKKSLKPDPNGVIWVNVGWKLTKNGSRSQGKISLGSTARDAERRLHRIEELWEQIERTSHTPLWDDFTFDIAKRFGKGEIQFPIKQNDGEDDYEYAARVNKLLKRFPSVQFAAENEGAYNEGVAICEDQIAIAITTEKEFAGLDFPVRPSRISDGTLHKAMDDYIEWIKLEYFDPDEGHVNDNGMTKIRQVKTLKEHLKDRPLADVDYTACDEMFGHFRKRPISTRTKKPMQRKSCQNYLGELGRFLDWLDLQERFRWRLPERFPRIKRRVDELESDIAAEAAEIVTFTDGELTLLYKYAGPLDRLFIVLGLNCAFGVDQTGRLKLGEVFLEHKPPIIKRIRRKKKVLGKHYLWEPTRTLLQWALEQRDKHASNDSEDFLILKQTGKPFWRKTAGGNRARDIPNYWTRLVSRIREDHADFPKVAFNTLRDTSVDRIRQIAGEEIASIHATHKHSSPDENLRRYSNAPWKKVYRAQRKLGRRLAAVFSAVPDPTIVPKQAYVSLGKRERILDLRADARPVAEIAREVGVSTMTVYRTLADAESQDA